MNNSLTQIVKLKITDSNFKIKMLKKQNSRFKTKIYQLEVCGLVDHGSEMRVFLWIILKWQSLKGDKRCWRKVQKSRFLPAIHTSGFIVSLIMNWEIFFTKVGKFKMCFKIARIKWRVNILKMINIRQDRLDL